MEQQIRFCTTADGVRIAYATVGHGPPIIKAASWYSHLEFDWQSPVYKGLYRGISARHRMIRYDARGTGLSDRNVAEISFETMVADFTAVAHAAGVDRFPLLGISQGGAVGIAYAVRHPERVSHLILLGAYARGMAHRPGHHQGPETMDALRAVMRQGWGSDDPSYRQLFTSQIIPDATPDQMRWFNEYERAAASSETADKLFVAIANINVMELLPLVRVPTLIFHCRGDRRQPFEFGRELATLIPDSRFVPLDSNNHVVLEHEAASDVFFAELADFLGHERPTVWHRRTRWFAGRFGALTRDFEASTFYKIIAIAAAVVSIASFVATLF